MSQEKTQTPQPARRPTGSFKHEPLSFEYPRHGHSGVAFRPLDVPEQDPARAMPGASLRQDGLERLPQLSEFDVVRHFTRLSMYNVAIDSAMYPLGSCTMKYNPRINETVARLPGFTGMHPLQPDGLSQGLLELMHILLEALKEITGFAAGTLQPAAGAQGELTGVLLIRSALEARGEHRRYMLVPDSAHGTNPASAHLAGFQVREVRSIKDGPAKGTVDTAHLAEMMDTEVAGLMLTNPNTLGVFEPEIVRIAEIVHAKGGYIYCDGANMNAQVGITRPADYGMDVIHLNLHKTFSTPHGGGGPGAGPCLCTAELEPFLPVPRVVKEGGEKDSGGKEPSYRLEWNAPQSIGKVATFHGNVGIMVRALSFILAMGPAGLREMTETAVLNAVYLRHMLKGVLKASTEAPTLHEVVFSDEGLATHGGINTMELAKRLMDYGFHPPTVYFPLTVPGALMVEPTESEPRAELDRFVEAIKAILAEADTNPELVKTAPHSAPRTRLDETRAARKPVLRWTPPE
ncbi:MAG: aminomethyl-transferring glycine dehydrogenase subunit GcvPB [Deltaproteobacteria bacterium]|nr:aminomethyl-transferring glycine dehydrogenase subunit GcvPB [Deltaproteobacteria bacterium]